MKKQYAKKSMLIKRAALATLGMSLVMAASIGVLYLNSQAAIVEPLHQCKGSTRSLSADGVVVIGEADLGCAGNNDKIREVQQKHNVINNTALVIGVVGLFASVMLTTYTYKKI